MFYSVSSLRRKQVGRSERLAALRRLARNLLISSLVVIMIFMVVGIVYVYTSRGNSYTPPAASASIPVEPFLLKPTPPNPRNSIGAAVQVLTSPVKPGQDVMLSVKTAATAGCDLKIAFPTGSSALGSLSATADAYGVATWNWRLSPDTPTGSWLATVTCKLGEHSAMVQTTLRVV